MNRRILVFPADDDALRAEVERALGDLAGEPYTTDDLEVRLRPWYRSIQVRPRDPLGGYADETSEVWYVYRDGRIRRRNEPLDGLYSALALARSTIRTSQEAISTATGLARRAGFRLEPGAVRRDDSSAADRAHDPILEPAGAPRSAPEADPTQSG